MCSFAGGWCFWCAASSSALARCVRTQHGRSPLLLRGHAICGISRNQSPYSIAETLYFTLQHMACACRKGHTGSAPLTRTSVVRTFGSQCRMRTFLGCPQHVSLWDMQRYRCMCRCSSVATEHGAEPQQGYGVFAACRSCAVSDALCWSVCHGVLLQGSGMICSGAACTAALLMSPEVESAAAGGAAATALVSNAICHLGTCHPRSRTTVKLVCCIVCKRRALASHLECAGQPDAAAVPCAQEHDLG